MGAMIRTIQGSFFRGAGLVVLAVISLFSLLEAGLDAGRNDYFNQLPRISHLSSTSLKVEWSLYPQFNKTTNYQVQLNNALYGFSTKETSKTLVNLEPGGSYRVAVVTYNEGTVAGVSSYALVLMRPSVPTSLAAGLIGTASCELSWMPVNTATAYRIYESPDKLLAEVEASVTRKLLTGLPPGAIMNFRVSAVNTTGESELSPEIKVQLLPVGPVVSIIENQIGSTWFSIRWQPVKNAIGYKILVNDAEVATAPADVSEYRVEGLPAGTAVAVKMTAVNQSGTSETSEPIIIQLAPSIPLLALTQVSSYSCTLQWSVANGASYYKVYLNKSFAVMNVPATINNVTLTEHITAGTTATYTVAAANDTGESEQSNAVVVTFTNNSAIVREAGDLEGVQASLYQFSDQRLPDNMHGKPVVWVCFPPELAGPELALEVSYLDYLTRSPEMANVRFIGVFTRETVKLKRLRRANLVWKKASAGNDVKIPGPLPMVRFYGPDGRLRGSTRIPMAILGPDEIYRELPESVERNEAMLQLYQENQERFDALHTPTN